MKTWKRKEIKIITGKVTVGSMKKKERYGRLMNLVSMRWKWKICVFLKKVRIDGAILRMDDNQTAT